MRITGYLTAILSIAAASFASVASAETLGQMSDSQSTPYMASPPTHMQVPATVAEDSVGNGAIPALPIMPQTVNGVTYINGGVGDEELAELKAKSGEFNLHIMLSAPAGEYISDVSLRIVDAKGVELLSVQDAGPYLYAALPDGSYTLEASSNGEAKTVKIKITGKGAVKKQIVFSESGGINSPHTPTTKLD